MWLKHIFIDPILFDIIFFLLLKKNKHYQELFNLLSIFIIKFALYFIILNIIYPSLIKNVHSYQSYNVDNQFKFQHLK
jgi:hypothetical protein